jgi:penicillin-binding protein 1A
MPRRRRVKKQVRSRNYLQNIRKYVAEMLRWPWFKNRFRNWRFKDFIKLGFLISLWSIILLAIGIFIFSMGLPDIQKAVDSDYRPTIILRDKNGHEFARLGDTKGEVLRVQDMSKELVHAVLAIEDRRFYSHYGVDPIGLARAVWTNFRSGRVVQGGSTITQQLAKNLFLSPDRTLTRKIKEALLAVYLENRYTKDQILAAYLNRAYFGAGAYGVDSAARVYFNSSARRLNVTQAAMLAGLLKAPSRYSPDNNPQLTVKRTRVVLQAMVDAGYLKPNQKVPVTTLPARDYNAAGSLAMRFYSDWIMGQVESYLGVTSQPLVIDTTLDSQLQNFAAIDISKTLARVGKERAISQAALLVMTPDGAIRAMVGGKDYGTSQYNRATVAKRQSGSSFKPILYLAALEKGYTPDRIVLDAPIRVGKYAPTNFDEKYRGNLRLQDAIAQSLNSVAIRVAQDIGVPAIKNMAQRLGITDHLTPDLSIALGTSDVRMISLVSAYATLANRGFAVEPYGINAIHSMQGKVLYQRREQSVVPILSIETVSQMNQMLQAVIVYGTGQAAMIDRPAAGKTGTSSNYRDAWFMGYSADLVGGVWVGNDNNTPMKRVTGGSVPAQIWRDVMLQAHRDLPVRPLATMSVVQNALSSDTVLPKNAEHETQTTSDPFSSLLESLLGPRQ